MCSSDLFPSHDIAGKCKKLQFDSNALVSQFGRGGKLKPCLCVGSSPTEGTKLHVRQYWVYPAKWPKDGSSRCGNFCGISNKWSVHPGVNPGHGWFDSIIPHLRMFTANNYQLTFNQSR